MAKDNRRYHGENTETAARFHDAVNDNYKRNFFTKESTKGDKHVKRNAIRSASERSGWYDPHSSDWYELPGSPNDYGMRSNSQLNKAMEKFRGNEMRKEREARQQAMAKEGIREWENHKYIDKVQTKTGKVRYIYEDTNNGGRTTLHAPTQQPKQSQRPNVDSTHSKENRHAAYNKSKPDIVKQGMDAVNNLIKAVQDFPLFKLFG